MPQLMASLSSRRLVLWLGWVLMALLLGGCSTLRGTRLLLPETFDFVKVSDNLYIEAGADAPTKVQLQVAAGRAKEAIQAAYGSVQSSPVIHACLSDRCLYRFGGEGTFGKAYGNRLLLSRRGLNWHFIAHEWSHAEMLARLDYRAWFALPQWFDEGFAVVVSEAPEHAESHWQYLEDHRVAKPSRDELLSLHTLKAWHAAGERYSDQKNAERQARGETEIHALYAMAGHEARTWFQGVGPAGLLALLESLNSGASFSAVYPVGPQRGVTP